MSDIVDRNGHLVCRLNESPVCAVYEIPYFQCASFLSLSLQGSLEIFTGLGLILGPPVGGWFYQSFGYEVPFMLLGCFLLIMVPFNIYILPTLGSSFKISRKSFVHIQSFVSHLNLVLPSALKTQTPRRTRFSGF